MEEWAREFPGAITVCDREYRILYMNERALATFGGDGGGATLVGTDLRTCHQPRSVDIMARIMESGEPNVYTIEKKGQRKLIYQAPWRREGRIEGLVELSLVIPAAPPHYVRG